MAFATNKIWQLARPFDVAGRVFYLNIDLWVSSGRVKVSNPNQNDDSQVEFVKFTIKTFDTDSQQYIYWGLTRNLTTTGTPTGQTPTVFWTKFSRVELVAMHDQIPDATEKQVPIALKTPTFASTGARDAVYTSPSNGDIAFVTGVWVTVYSGGAWVTLGVGTPPANASETVSGISELATNAEVLANTQVWGTGARTIVSVANTKVISAGAWDAGTVPVRNSSGILDPSNFQSATETQSGESEIATAAEQLAWTLSGSSGKRLVAGTSAMKSTSAWAGDAGKIPLLSASGLLDSSMLPPNLSTIRIFSYSIGYNSFTTSLNVTIPHTLGITPKAIFGSLLNTRMLSAYTPQNGNLGSYILGSTVLLNNAFFLQNDNTNPARTFSFNITSVDATNINATLTNNNAQISWNGNPTFDVNFIAIG